MCVCVCVCVCGGGGAREFVCVCVCVWGECVCVCVWGEGGECVCVWGEGYTGRCHYQQRVHVYCYQSKMNICTHSFVRKTSNGTITASESKKRLITLLA